MTPVMTFMELEAENARLRSEIVELRELYREALEKLGTVAALVSFEPDKTLPVIVDQVQIRMEAVPALKQANIQAAAKWIEDFWRSTKDATGILVYEKSEGTWARFAHDAQALIEALRRR